MAFTDEALKAKLSTLNETQDSIVSVSQWIMFHKRHADRIANYWLTRLRDSPPPKRLNFIYLVNDIVQNARARRRPEFPDAFSPLMPEAMQTAYRSSTPEIQSKIRRVLEVWRTRNVFETPIQEAIESRLDEIDKTKSSTGKKTLMGNSLFNSSSGSGIPKELETLAPLQIAVTKANLAARPPIDTAQSEYAKLNDPAIALPSPPVYAARLSSLIKSLATAESSVSASIKAQQALIADLEKFLETTKEALAKDEETYLDLGSRKLSTEAKKREVEDSIMRGLTSNEDSLVSNTPRSPDMQKAKISTGNDNDGRDSDVAGFYPERPEVEELTPEPDGLPVDHSEINTMLDPVQSSNPTISATLAGFEDTGIIVPTTSRVRPASGGHQGMNGSGVKRRKTSYGNDDSIVPDLGEMGMENLRNQQVPSEDRDLLGDLDEDVNELLRQEGGMVT